MGETVRKRIHFVDELRGLDILLMVVFHAAYVAGWIFEWEWGRRFFLFFKPVEPFFSGIFIFICGISCRLSRSNLKRGLMIGACALLMSLTLWFFMPDQMIWFGILHFLGAAMMLLGLCEPLLRKIPAAAGVLLSAVLYLATDSIGQGWIGLGPLRLELPRALYNAGFLFPLGLHPLIFASADYYPLLPWIFLFLAGFWLGEAFYQRRMPDFCYREHLPALGWLGRHALIIYLVHQPVVYGVLWLADWLL